MISTLAPSEVIKLTPEQKQNYMLMLFASIDASLKRLLVWAVPNGVAKHQEHATYEAHFKDEPMFSVSDFFGLTGETLAAVAAVAAVAENPVAAPKRKAAVKAQPVAETTLGNAPVITSVPEVQAITINELREKAQAFILEATANGEDGKAKFLAVLQANNASSLTGLATEKYGEVLAAISKVSAPVEAPFDPLA